MHRSYRLQAFKAVILFLDSGSDTQGKLKTCPGIISRSVYSILTKPFLASLGKSEIHFETNPQILSVIFRNSFMNVFMRLARRGFSTNDCQMAMAKCPMPSVKTPLLSRARISASPTRGREYVGASLQDAGRHPVARESLKQNRHPIGSWMSSICCVLHADFTKLTLATRAGRGGQLPGTVASVPGRGCVFSRAWRWLRPGRCRRGHPPIRRPPGRVHMVSTGMRA